MSSDADGAIAAIVDILAAYALLTRPSWPSLSSLQYLQLLGVYNSCGYYGYCYYGYCSYSCCLGYPGCPRSFATPTALCRLLSPIACLYAVLLPLAQSLKKPSGLGDIVGRFLLHYLYCYSVGCCR